MRVQSASHGNGVEDARRLRWIGWGIAVLAAGGAYLALGDLNRNGITGGILLLVVTLAGLGVAIGSTSATESESRDALDLSGRLALGVLGGVLGGVVSAVAALILVTAGLPAALGVALPAGAGPLAFGGQAVSGAFWGLVFGILYPWIPGRDAVTRGMIASLLPALHLLLNVYPLELGVGWFGANLGALTFLFVIFFELIWGVTAGAVVRWGEHAEGGPISRPPGA